MLDTARIVNSDYFDDQESSFLVEIPERLENVLGSPLSEAECVALMRILSIYTFTWDDGFSTISTERRLFIGLLSAAWIASAFADDKYFDGEWLYQMTLDGPFMKYDELIEPLLKRTLASGGVRISNHEPQQ